MTTTDGTLEYAQSTPIRISVSVIRTGYADPNKRVEVWAKDYLATAGMDLALADHMGSQELGIDDLSGLSLGEFRRRIKRLYKRTTKVGDDLAAVIPEAIYCDPLFPTNKDPLIGKHPAEVAITVQVVP